MTLHERVRQFVRRHDLFRAETRVVVALSGGSDSVALAHLLSDLAAAGEVRLAGLAHFNHQLRATASRDEAFSRSVAAALGVPLLVDRGDVAARAKAEKRSLEDAARESRYEFFERARQHFDADLVALGHTRDDQAETFLLRLIRGAGLRGLSAIHPRRATIVRPLLECRRSELRACLAERGIDYVDDESNADVSIPRNRVRAELLPLLEDRFNPGIVETLAAEAELARETWAWMESTADELFERAVKRRPAHGAVVCELEVAVLTAAHRAERRMVLWRAMNEVAGRRSISFRHVADALRLVERVENVECAPPGAIDIPGMRVERKGAVVVLTGRPPNAAGRPPAPPGILFEYPLSIPGEVALVEAGCLLSVEPLVAGGSGADTLLAAAGPVAVIRGDLCRSPLAVRNRRPGDRFQPVGLDGRKKLQDYFVDRKVALACRDRVPLVVDQEGRILWVAGYSIDEAFRVTDPSQGMLILRLKVLGGSA
jgi:tRNA(Ile)-lysidine synthase